MQEKLLLLHGAMGSKNQFNSLKEKLEISFDVSVMNFEGHGGTESSYPFSIDLFTQNVIDYLQENSISEVNIFGYSMGGYVALNAALRLPEKIRKVITLGTKLKWDTESTEREIKMLNPIKIEEKVPHFAEKLKKEHHPQDWKQIMKKTAKMMVDMSKGAKLVDDDFKKISQYVVIGVGSLDNMVSLEESKHISTLITNSKLINLEKVQHPIDKIEVDVLVDYIRSN